MTQTVADASRSYRQRRAEKMERMEAALQRIIEYSAFPESASRDDYNRGVETAWAIAAGIARQALNPGKEMGE